MLYTVYVIKTSCQRTSLRTFLPIFQTNSAIIKIQKNPKIRIQLIIVVCKCDENIPLTDRSANASSEPQKERPTLTSVSFFFFFFFWFLFYALFVFIVCICYLILFFFFFSPQNILIYLCLTMHGAHSSNNHLDYGVFRSENDQELVVLMPRD